MKSYINRFKESKTQLRIFSGAVLVLLEGLPFIYELLPSNNLAIGFYIGIHLIALKALQTFLRSFFDKKEIVLGMSFSEKVKIHRYNTGTDILTFLIITATVAGIAFIIYTLSVSNSSIKISTMMVSWFGFFFIPFVKTLLSFIKGYE